MYKKYTVNVQRTFVDIHGMFQQDIQRMFKILTEDFAGTFRGHSCAFEDIPGMFLISCVYILGTYMECLVLLGCTPATVSDPRHCGVHYKIIRATKAPVSANLWIHRVSLQSGSSVLNL
uniref:Uncharacterized protein LOC114340245 n=1 Tax=Diabrotica virgifera virgifera TaxID=50390 RepID=A0A6P7GNK1_DIAVI